MSKIKSVFAREILDSRGNPTVCVELETESGVRVSAGVPSGASTGTHEALEMRDGDSKRYGGKGVLKAVENVNKIIAPAVVGHEVVAQKELDELMIALDGTENKSKLGANAILGVSLAAAQAAAQDESLALWQYFAKIANTTPSLPVPFFNVINGGAHADNNLDLQECMLAPTGFATFEERLRAGAEVFHALKKILKDKGLVTTVGDEGGFAPNLASNEEAFGYIVQAIEQAGYTGKVQIGIDAAASEFYKDGTYHIDGKSLSASELTAYYGELCAKYPIISIEDSHSEDDFAGFAECVEKLQSKIQIVGDDLLVTNPKRIAVGIEQKLSTAALIKVNQIGTLTETIEAVRMAHAAGWKCMISHRSGETCDTTIADLVVGLGTGQIKSGSTSRSERLEKYNRLLRIELEMAGKAKI